MRSRETTANSMKPPVEDKINHVVSGAPHLIVTFNNSNTMIQRISKICMAHGTNGDSRASKALEVGSNGSNMRSSDIWWTQIRRVSWSSCSSRAEWAAA